MDDQKLLVMEVINQTNQSKSVMAGNTRQTQGMRLIPW